MTNGTSPGLPAPLPAAPAAIWETYRPASAGPPQRQMPMAPHGVMPPPMPATGLHAQQRIVAPPPIPGTGLNSQMRTSQVVYLPPQTIYVAAHPTKSLALAYLLWFFLGVVGVHQFYLGKVGRGASYVFTGAWVTVGWWIDLFTLPKQVQQVNERQLGTAIAPQQRARRDS